jgi:hypothetical protein
LLQPHSEKSSRTFSDHDTVAQAIDCTRPLPKANSIVFIAGYEKRLKELNPSVRNLRYETRDLMSFIDNLPDLGILMYHRQ